MARSVVALDPTVGGVSVARITDGVDTPTAGYLESDKLSGKRSPRTDLHKHVKFVASVVERVMENPPTLVVLAKLAIAPIRSKGGGDPTAARRAGVWWELVRAFDTAGVPIGEVSILTVGKVVLGKGQWGQVGYAALAAEINRAYPDIVHPTDEHYRPTTVGLAACGAIAVGIPMAWDVTDARLRALAAGSDFPTAWTPPPTLREYQQWIEWRHRSGIRDAAAKARAAHRREVAAEREAEAVSTTPEHERAESTGDYAARRKAAAQAEREALGE